MCRGHRTQWRRMPLARDAGNSRVRAPSSPAARLARALGQNAVDASGAGVRNYSWHGVLWTPCAYRSRNPERTLELKVEGDVGRKRCIAMVGERSVAPASSRRCGRDAPTTAAGTVALEFERF